MNYRRVLLAIAVVVPIVGGYFLQRWWRRGGGGRAVQVFSWFRDTSLFPEKRMRAGERCGSAPFIFPIDGMVGFIWGDSFGPTRTHQGVDIFPGTSPGQTPVYAVYAGYLTRLADWVSSVIVRVPSDPLNPDRQIWVYYTHMADSSGASFIDQAFAPGTGELYIEAGELLGYAGNYSGDPNDPTGVHLHISIVKDDGSGAFTNELLIRNTFDPSPYFGLPLNARENPNEIPTCQEEGGL